MVVVGGSITFEEHISNVEVLDLKNNLRCSFADLPDEQSGGFVGFVWGDLGLL